MQLTKEQMIAAVGISLVIMIGFGTFVYRHLFATAPPEELLDTPLATTTFSHRKVLVHIVGAVKNEGVYKVNLGDRLVDVIEAAGGAGREAELSLLNLAEEVKDGQKITVPVKRILAGRKSGDPATRLSLPAGRHGGTSLGKVNINSASNKELCKVPGIGPSTAKKIIEYREKNGPFAKPEDITKVSRIGKKTYERLKDRLVI